MSKNSFPFRTSGTETGGDRLPKKAVIGLPIPIEHAKWRVWEGQVHLLSLGYTTHLQTAGASVMLLPVPAELGDNLHQDAADLVARIDGLAIAGGSDVNPVLYGAIASPRSGPFDTVRDSWEAALIRAAIEADVPVFGICRGLQLLNVVLGGTLIQHLPDHVQNDTHNPSAGAFGSHRVRTHDNSWLRTAIGESLDVATYHHQAIDRLGDGLAVTADAEDGTIEGVEDLARGLIGVQWHPEARDHAGVFTHFVELCEQNRG